MDYKQFILELDNAKKELIDFINSSNKKNLVKADKIVNEYLNEMSKGNYSIKSYKAKIIHNELEHSRTRREITPLKEEVSKKTNQLLDEYFAKYLDELNNLNIFSNKTKDLRDFIQNNRRQKHDVLLKRNNVEKEYNLRTKEFEVSKNELITAYNDKISELKFKLSNSLKKSNEKTIKEFQEYETMLLDCNDLQEIKKIKENIKNVRLVGLDEEYSFKVETYQTILDEELTYNQNYFNFVINYENYQKDTQNKLAEYEKTNNELNIYNDFRDKSYEYELRKQKLELLLLECDKFVEKVNKHNQRINKDYSCEHVTIDDKLFLFDIIEINFYRLLLAIRKNNLYDPLINVFIDLIDGLKTLRSSFKDVYENIINSQTQKEEKLRFALDAYVPETKKKTPKEELIANVLTSLNRYFINFTNELDNFIRIVFDFYMNLINKLTISYDETKELNSISDFGCDCFIFQTNYNFVDLDDYGYVRSKNNYKGYSPVVINKNNIEENVEEIEIELDLSDLVIENKTSIDNEVTILSNELKIDEEKEFLDSLENNLIKLEAEIRTYCNTGFKEIEDRIKELEENKNAKILDLENIYKESIKENEKKYKQIFETMSNEKLIRDKNIKKSTTKYIANAKKLLSESKAML